MRLCSALAGTLALVALHATAQVPPTIADKLKAMDYAGWIVVEAEQDPAKAPPYDYSKLGYEHILMVCDRAGLEIDPRA